MIDLGRPAHVYDLNELKGAVTARRARDGETVLALNEKEYVLDNSMTVIADEAQVHDIGGIMGGEHSGVSEGTTDALLEIAFFDPDRIARTGQKLGLTSDARSRFERGVDPAFLDDGLALLTGLILDICGGEASAVVRAGEPPVPDRRVTFDPARTLALGGLDVDPAEQQAILESLGFAIEGGEALVPSWRRDIDGSADLVEEVTRIAGYDQIPSAALPRDEGVAKPVATRAQIAERRMRRMAAARGLDEAVTWSFISEDEAEQFGGAPDVVANPISAEMSHMRPSLLPGLIAAARRNFDRGATGVRLFEVGRRYLAEGERPTAALLCVRRMPARAAGRTDKPAILGVRRQGRSSGAARSGRGAGADLQLFMDAGPTWHPGRSAKLGLGPKTVLARFGELHPSIARGLPATVAAELYLDAIPEARSAGHARPTYTPPALQSVTRDFAFVMPDALAAESLVRAIRGATSGDHRRAGVRPVPAGGRRAQPGDRGDVAARRAELHRSRNCRNCEPDRRRRRKARGAAAQLVVQPVNGLVDPGFYVVALEAGGNDFSDQEANRTRPLGEAPVPDPAAVMGDRHHRQPQRAVEAGETRTQFRALAMGNARAFGKDDDRAALADRTARLREHDPQRLGAGFAIDADDAITPRHPAKERDLGQFALHDDDGGRGQAQGLDRLDHGFVLAGNQIGAIRDASFDRHADGKHMGHQPVVIIRPAVNDPLHRPVADRRQQDDRQHIDERPRVEEQSEQERTKERHQMSSQTATRRRRNLLYSPNRVVNPGSVRTASGMTW